MVNDSEASDSLAPVYVVSRIEEKEENPSENGDAPEKYGELILLGYNGSQESTRSNSNGKKHKSRLLVCKRKEGNGIKKGHSRSIVGSARDNAVVNDSTRHIVSYSYTKTHTVLVEFLPDRTKDMFQIGRSSEPQIDFVVVDTWLALSPDAPLSPASNKDCSPNISQLYDEGGKGDKQCPIMPGNRKCLADAARREEKEIEKLRPASSTISRYACRIQIDRVEPHNAYLFAAGFDASRNIFLGEKATKWTKPDGNVDGLTTNGILILQPHSFETKDEEVPDEDCRKMYLWREVSVDGDIYNLRKARSSTTRGDLVRDETNQLQDGTLIDLCGATLLWRTQKGLLNSPSRDDLEQALEALNAGRPQCPVSLNTLKVPKKKSANSGSSKQPYVYLNCGHVQGKHDWGLHNVSNTTAYTCPVCRSDSTKVTQLVMGMESAFHLDSATLDHAFNPCGHVASLATVRYWSRIPLPHGTNSFHPVCPFCTSLLDEEKPYVRLIFQDHCFE
ncbi:unnamed protein product [Enterobius vermicularis]|uniref:Protein pellino n=1 Tax=Enterobius vermicularis TaxID=51028 RepID=A0A0N4V935_ENTVE|nr:unnamed protein product [Enterobius vermicularis]